MSAHPHGSFEINAHLLVRCFQAFVILVVWAICARRDHIKRQRRQLQLERIMAAHRRLEPEQASQPHRNGLRNAGSPRAWMPDNL